MWLYFVGVTLFSLAAISHCRFYSGTFSWKKDDHSNNIHIVYRLAWEKGTGPCGSGCNSRHVGRNTTLRKTNPSIANLSIVNDKTTLGDVHYVITDVSTTNVSGGWEQGENSYVFRPPSNKTIVYLKAIPWIRSGDRNSQDLGYLETTIDTRVRNDTKRSNISPVASIPPYVGVQYGCKTTAMVAVVDPDGDRVMCRWSRPPECKGACTNVPPGSIQLHESSCSIEVDAGSQIKAGRFYRLAIVIEDFPDYNVTVGSDVYTKQQSFSSIPYQLSLWVSTSTVHCGLQNMTFVTATPRDSSSIGFTVLDISRKNKGLNTSFYVQTEHLNSFEFILSGPRGLSSDILPDDLSGPLNRTGVMKLSMVWKPDFRTQIGGSQVCVWGIDLLYGLTTDPRCVTIFSGDYNQCSTTVCNNNGTCKNVYGDVEKCVCKAGFTDHTCSTKTPCYNSPCQNNGSCSYTSDVEYDCSCVPGFTGKTCSSDMNRGPKDEGNHKTLLWAIIGAIVGFLILVVTTILVYKAIHQYDENSDSRKITPSHVDICQ